MILTIHQKITAQQDDTRSWVFSLVPLMVMIYKCTPTEISYSFKSLNFYGYFVISDFLGFFLYFKFFFSRYSCHM